VFEVGVEVQVDLLVVEPDLELYFCSHKPLFLDFKFSLLF